MEEEFILFPMTWSGEPNHGQTRHHVFRRGYNHHKLFHIENYAKQEGGRGATIINRRRGEKSATIPCINSYNLGMLHLK